MTRQIPTNATQLGFARLPEIIGVRDPSNPARYLKPPLIPVSRSAWYRGIELGRFPKPVHIGPRTVAWKREDIEALMASFPA
jgi:predicted DNA-binding transcriptional regulator AlpA